MEGKKRSPIWKFFSVVEQGGKTGAKCSLCAATVSYSGGSTGTMANHLKFKHKSLINIDNNDKNGNSHSQKLITAFSQRATSMSEEHWQRCTEALACMCARDLRPMSIVERVGFKTFCNTLNPAFKVPGKTTIAKYISISYDEMKEELVRLLNKQIGVALTCDHWTSCGVEGYLTVTAHFVDDEFYYHNCVLATRQTTERHTGMNIAQDLKAVISEFGIEKEGVTALVSDNASNMVACMEHMDGIMHIRCFGDTLQLSIRGAFDDIPSISDTIVAGRKLVSYFRRSVVANNELKVRQKQMHLPEHSLILDCPTRWNSTFDMFERLIEQRLSVYAVVHNMNSPGDARILDLIDSHCTIIEGMIPVLKPLYMATRIMCSEEYPTISGLYPILYILKNHNLLVKDTDCQCGDFQRKVTRKH
ncbi:E3 SUMO-protein ligase ZBED1-like [Gigantopelta aegis]|uniref:E3 SUMO-protein ligase ZBED1-like n=1 Tax=Gigantopelta aegis TaxID=1735272 RepID=UPI001B88D85B|nr:E3 SUMO-protein ligase ZBED1-like [Gigantopelta aegis]